MLEILTDENFDARILRGLLARSHEIDALRVQDCGLSGREDPDVLAWSAREGRVLVTHDASTVPFHAIRRVRAGETLPGVVVVSASAPIGRIIDELLLLLQATEPEEIADRILFLPF